MEGTPRLSDKGPLPGAPRTGQPEFASPPTLSLPKGGGAIQGIGEKFAANPVTGTGSMTVPIATSPGRAGLGPQLSLSYDSGAENGPLGFGWSLSLPSISRKTDKGLPQYRDAEESDTFVLSGAEFDFNTIADVILHVRYTAREGGNTLRSSAVANLNNSIANAKTSGSVRLFSMRQEFPADWAKFKSVAIGGAVNTAPLSIATKPEHYPFWSQGRLQDVLSVTLLATSTKDLQVSDKPDGTGNNDALVKNEALGGLRSGPLKNIPLPHPRERGLSTSTITPRRIFGWRSVGANNPETLRVTSV